MVLSHDALWNQLVSILEKKLSAQHSWEEFIASLEVMNDKPFKAQLQQLNLSEDVIEIGSWLNTVPTMHPIPNSIKALWIGIAQVYDESQEKEFNSYYIQGASEYAPDNIDWATTCDYTPQAGYWVSEHFNKISSITRNDDNFETLDWILPLAYSAFVLSDIIRAKLDRSIFLQNRATLTVTTGFDSGDYINLDPLIK